MKKIFLFAILFGFISCGGADLDLTQFKSKEIIFPKELSCYYNGENTTMNIVSDLKSKMIVYVNSTQCSSCQISRLYEWKEFVDYKKWTRGKFGVVFMFSPKAEDYDEFVRVVKNSITSEVAIVLDNEERFLGENTHIPKNINYHTFLLDENNKVVVVGNPMGNEKLWELYKEQIIAK